VVTSRSPNWYVAVPPLTSTPVLPGFATVVEPVTVRLPPTLSNSRPCPVLFEEESAAKVMAPPLPLPTVTFARSSAGPPAALIVLDGLVTCTVPALATSPAPAVVVMERLNANTLVAWFVAASSMPVPVLDTVVAPKFRLVPAGAFRIAMPVPLTPVRLVAAAVNAPPTASRSTPGPAALVVESVPKEEPAANVPVARSSTGPVRAPSTDTPATVSVPKPVPARPAPLVVPTANPRRWLCCASVTPAPLPFVITGAAPPVAGSAALNGGRLSPHASASEIEAPCPTSRWAFSNVTPPV